MFTGIDEVDWASLRHAYGSARDVPGWLRGLASAEPAERADALDRLYDAVHDQGRVYDSTLACVPFLLALAADERVRERGGLVELLVSIGGDADTGAAAVRSGAELFTRLAGDPDAEVRRAAAGAAVRFLDAPARVLALLRERLAVERDDRLVIALVENLGHFVRHHPARPDEALELLAARSRPPHGPGPRLAALGQLAVCAPELLPADLVTTVVGLVAERSARRPAPEPAPAGATLADRLRRLRPSDEEGALLLRSLHTALGDRLPERTALLHGQLTSPAATDRCTGVWLSASLLREWRGDHSATVAGLGEQLKEDDGRLRDAAVSVLTGLFALAAPAADPLHTLVASRPDLWTRLWRREVPALGVAVQALARSGDRRAVPVLAELLTRPVVPRDLGSVVGHLGAAAAPLAPALRRALAAVAPDSADAAARATPLLRAVGDLRDAAAVPEVLRLLDAVRSARGERLTRAALGALGALGSAAREAVPALRALLDGAYGLDAADALWAVEGDASAVLPVLLRELTARSASRRARTAQRLAPLGAAARPALPALRRMA
ncbi:HEAT repeat domain-containing protein, partial [Streptomyces sp. A012304]|uniref:HEAT repeat domain-containing protein n=1 Tax=Streptomyces sp. A012304 TaxID=375446 RepID=UPI00222F986F